MDNKHESLYNKHFIKNFYVFCNYFVKLHLKTYIPILVFDNSFVSC